MATELHCSKDAFERLHIEADRKRRKGTTKIPVEAEDLKVLLRDHSALIRALQDQGKPIAGPGVTR